MLAKCFEKGKGCRWDTYRQRELQRERKKIKRIWEKLLVPALATMRAALLAFGVTASVPDSDTAVTLTSPGR
jgi:hypothetical protein